MLVSQISETVTGASVSAVVPASNNCCMFEAPSQMSVVPALQLQSLQAPQSSPGARQLSAAGQAASLKPAAAALSEANHQLHAPQALNELASWTQNTARALRRAQQEVTELCAAHGVPLPKEKPILFDVVSMRSSGVQGSERGQPISSSNGSNSSNGCSTKDAGKSSNASAVQRRHRHAKSAATVNHHSRDMQEECSCPASSSAASASSSSDGAVASATSQAPMVAVGPPVYQRIYHYQPLDAVLAEQDAQLATAAATEASGHRANAMQRLRQQQQQRNQQDHEQRQEQQRQLQQRRQRREQHLLQPHFLSPNQQQQQQQRSAVSPPTRPFTAPRTQSAPSKPICTAMNCSTPFCCNVNSGAATPPVCQSMTRRREPNKPLARTNHHLKSGHSARGQLNNQLPRHSIDTSNAGLGRELQASWWAGSDRALGDPLLLCMPVWMREALELELMK